MHPAKSVIFFTTASGAGYGLFMALVLALNLDVLEVNPTQIIWVGIVSFILVTLGLFSSLLHLGHPERAWRALSQWRSSWLSREGVFAILTYPVAFLYIFALVYLEKIDGWVGVVGWGAAMFCFLTVYSTSMIYKSLKPISAWANGFTTPIYLLMSITSGLLVLNFLNAIFGNASPKSGLATLLGLFITQISKILYWRYIDASNKKSNLGTATGLGKGGKVTPLEKPHTEANYLMKEMGFQVGRRHSQKLRNLFLFFWIISATLIATPYFFPIQNLGFISMAALLFSSIAIIFERWLFFAEAKHTVALYYNG